MLKKLFIILLLPVLLFSAQTITQNYSFEEPQIIDGVAYLQGCRTSRDAFAPCVAEKPVKLLVPYGHKIVSFSVNYGEPTLMKGQHSLVPFRPSGRLSVSPPKGYYTRMSDIYARDSFFPAAVRSDRYHTQVKNGHTIFLTKVNPVQYNAISGQIRYFKNISINLFTEPTRAGLPKYHCTPFIKSYLKLMVDNTAAVDQLALSEQRPDDYEYLIVTKSSFMSSFDKFVEFNERRCMRTRVMDISQVLSSSSGRDKQDKLRNYINSQYKDNNIVFVLLGGDVADVPYRGMHASIYDYGTDYYDDKNIPADMYYSCLDGTWQNPGTNTYGDYGCEDIGWEVYTARFSVGSGTELNNMINKTIKFQESPVKSTITKNILAGEFLWGRPQHPVDCWGGDCMDQFIGTSNANSYTTKGFGSNWNKKKLYDKVSDWKKSTFISTTKSVKPTWIDHLGHSNNTYIIKCNTGDVTNNNFTNNGSTANYFMIYTQGCYPNNFTYSDCIGEYFTSRISNGAFAFIGNSRYGLGDDGAAGSSGTDGSSQRLHRHFHDALFGANIHYLEMMNAYSKEINVDIIKDSDIRKPPYYGQVKWCAYEVNILGDPAISMWTDTPKEFAKTPSISGTTFNLETPAYTWVALLDKDKKIVATVLTGDGSNSNCALTYANMSEVQFYRVKAHNYMPFEGEAPTAIQNNILLGINEFVKINTLGQNVRVNFNLNTKNHVNLSIYNSKGSLIKSSINKSGIGELTLNNISNGIYYLRLQSKDLNYTDKFIISR